MKTLLKYFATTAVIMFLFSSLTFAQQGQSSPVEAVKIAENLYQLNGGSGANGGFYVGDDAVLLIDTKMSEQSVHDELAAIMKITTKPIKYLVLTHADGDHVNGNVFLQDGVTIIAHENCYKEFFVSRDGSPTNWEKPEMAKGLPQILFNDRMDIRIGNKIIELYYFGRGHTTGDTYIYFREEGVAFIGDQYFEGRVPLFHTYKNGSAVAFGETMKKMLDAIPATKFCSGHAPMVSRDKVVEYVNSINSMVEKINTLIKQKKSLDDIKGSFSEGEATIVEGIYNDLVK